MGSKPELFRLNHTLPLTVKFNEEVILHADAAWIGREQSAGDAELRRAHPAEIDRHDLPIEAVIGVVHGASGATLNETSGLDWLGNQPKRISWGFEQWCRNCRCYERGCQCEQSSRASR